MINENQIILFRTPRPMNQPLNIYIAEKIYLLDDMKHACNIVAKNEAKISFLHEP